MTFQPPSFPEAPLYEEQLASSLSTDTQGNFADVIEPYIAKPLSIPERALIATLTTLASGAVILLIATLVKEQAHPLLAYGVPIGLGLEVYFGLPGLRQYILDESSQGYSGNEHRQVLDADHQTEAEQIPLSIQTPNPADAEPALAALIETYSRNVFQPLIDSPDTTRIVHGGIAWLSQYYPAQFVDVLLRLQPDAKSWTELDLNGLGAQAIKLLIDLQQGALNPEDPADIMTSVNIALLDARKYDGSLGKQSKQAQAYAIMSGTSLAVLDTIHRMSVSKLPQGTNTDEQDAAFAQAIVEELNVLQQQLTTLS